MTLPDLGKLSVESTSVAPLGLDYRGEDVNFFKESLNLEYDSGCCTRKSRKQSLAWSYAPTQTITCNDRVFFRTANKFAEITETENGLELSDYMNLSSILTPPKRHFVQFEKDIYIFPDMLRYNAEDSNWSEFAPGAEIEVKLPLINEYALFYPADESGTVSFAESDRLALGVNMRLSWMDEIFTVIKREWVTKTTFDEETQTETVTEEGVVVWLDKPITGCLLVNGGIAEIKTDALRPAADPLCLGCGNRGGGFSGNSIKFNTTVGEYTYADDPANYFGVGQKVTISGATASGNNCIATVRSIAPGLITFDTAFTKEDFSEGQIITITPIFSQIDFACALNGRIFVVDNSTKLLRASKYGRPMVFYGGDGEETGSWKCDLSDECTGLTAYKNQIICFSDSGGIKIYGTNADNFSPVRLPVSGIKSDMQGTLCTLRDTLIYLSSYGVMKYSGTVDSKISSAVDIAKPTVALADGFRYYLLDGDKIYVYSIENDCWWCEDGENILNMFMLGGKRYYVKEEGIYLAEGEEIPFKWSFETSQLPPEEGYKAQPISLNIQLSSKKGCEIYAYMRTRGRIDYTPLMGQWISGESTLKIPLKKMWCDGFSLKLSGKGDIEFKSIIVRYRRKSIC